MQRSLNVLIGRRIFEGELVKSVEENEHLDKENECNVIKFNFLAEKLGISITDIIKQIKKTKVPEAFDRTESRKSFDEAPKNLREIIHKNFDCFKERYL